MTYLSHVSTIKSKQKSAGLALASLSIGQRVRGNIKQIKGGSATIQLLVGIEGIALINEGSNLFEGESVLCVILWLDFVNNRADVIMGENIVNKINEIQDKEQFVSDLSSRTLICETLMVKEELVIGVLKGNKQIVFLPTISHTNDLCPMLNDHYRRRTYEVTFVGTVFEHAVCLLQGSDKKCKRNHLKKSSENNSDISRRTQSTYIIPIDLQLNSEDPQQNTTKTQKLDLKRSLPKSVAISSESPAYKKSKKPSKEPNHQQVNKMDTQKNLQKHDELRNQEDCDGGNKKNQTQGLLNANDFFKISTDCFKPNTSLMSSNEDSDDENQTVKNKLGNSEKEDILRNDEKKVRENEIKFAESYDNPQTADDYDRLLLANPNDSKTWISYMAYHLQATEIEKARAVARKALLSISFREEQEKLNVWIALLNLENRFGTKETFNDVLQEALNRNDSYSIHMQAILILSESYKVQDLNDLINKALKKYNHKLECWLDVGQACFKAKLLDRARQIMQKGLNVLDNNKHVELLTRFAFMENHHGFPERAQALLEQVLTSYPRRIDVWSQYIDMLVKSSQIDIARDVLRRAVSQSLSAKKMKILFKKFLDFESKFGDDEAVDRVRQMAEEYVRKAIS